MKRYQRFVAGGLVIAGLAGLYGCEGEKELPDSKYFATVKMHYRSGMALTSGDFDSDGDIDLIVGSQPGGLREVAGLYLFKMTEKAIFHKRMRLKKANKLSITKPSVIVFVIKPF